MKRTWFSSLFIFLLLPLRVSGDGIGSPQADESMARVQRLLMASIFELPAEQWLADSNATGYQDFPAYKRFLQEAPNTNYTYQILLPFVCKIDGSNMRSTGDPDILSLTRDFLVAKIEKPDWQSAAYALLYLSQKGDPGDLRLLEEYAIVPSKLNFARQSAQESLRILSSRIFGTNVLNFSQTRYYSWSTNSPPFLPSVANTGPQAVYVYELLKQALEKYGSPENIPPELVTLTVTLDTDGKPICNIDPAKYGLVMPSFSVRKEPFSLSTKQAGEEVVPIEGKPTPPLRTAEQEEVDVTNNQSSSAGRVWPFVIGGVVLAALILFRIKRR